MADYFPLIANTSASQIQELPSGDNLNLLGSNIVNAGSIAGTLSTASQPNITSVGTLGSLSVTGNVTAGNVSGTNITGTLTTAAQTNITSVGTLTSLTSSGNIQGANVIATSDVYTPEIVKTGSNGVGNIGQSTNTFNTVFAKATSAQYADVAEFYRADADYPIGTVLEFGGNQEVTAAASSHSTAIAGTVSESPAVIMNSGLEHEHKTAVALLGRVPCRVVGSIQKGDRLVASHNAGVATVLDPANYSPGCIVGKSLENYNSDQEGVIEIVVGRL